MVRRRAKGSARKTSPAVAFASSDTNQPRSAVGKKDLDVGSFSVSTLAMWPICTKPVKKIIVNGVP